MCYFSNHPAHRCYDSNPHNVFSSRRLQTSKVRKSWTFNPFYPELSGMLVTFYTVILGFLLGCLDFFFFHLYLLSFLFFETPTHPKTLVFFLNHVLFFFFIPPLPFIILCSFSLNVRDWANPMKVNVGRFLAPTQTLKTMSAFRDGVSWYVLVYNIFIHPGVNGFFWWSTLSRNIAFVS